MQKEVDGIQGGIVLREFNKLRSIGMHPKSGMPISQEFRAFVLDGSVISLSKYWEYGDYAEDEPPISLIKKIANKVVKNIGSNFFTIDMAQNEDKNWICIEVSVFTSLLPEVGALSETEIGPIVVKVNEVS